jgi:hypothetical protein
MQKQNNFQFYATLLDNYQNYIDADLNYDKFWGFSENPPCTAEEYVIKQRAALIDSINRVPFESEAADKGTAFNEVIDCIIENRKSDKMDIKVERIAEAVSMIRVDFNSRLFYFDVGLCKEFAKQFNGAVTQKLVEAILPTSFGNVRLYGYIDELMPFKVHDIKTTSSYYVGKFKTHWQHLVYPYCLIQSGVDIRDFEYNIVEMGKRGCQVFTECYTFEPERDIPRLRERCEELIKFLRDHYQFITNQRIFGGENPKDYVGTPVDINLLH